jgi:ribosomal protein S18 acetylase RimI-like enzyme
MIEIVIATPADLALFDRVDEDVFDGPLDPARLASYLADPRLHVAVAIDRTKQMMVGMCSGLHYHHPDKPPQMWINELGVAGPWRRQGIATDLVAAMCAHATTLDCTEIWVVADPTDMAEGFYESLGWVRTGERLAMFSAPLHAS